MTTNLMHYRRLLQATLPLQSALQTGEPVQILVAAGPVAQAAGDVGQQLVGQHSGAWLSANAAYQDQITEHLQSCCWNILQAVQLMHQCVEEQPDGEYLIDLETFQYALNDLCQNIDLLGAAF